MDVNAEEIREHLEHETTIREKLRDETTSFEKTIRVIVATLNRIHSTPPPEGVVRQPLS